MSTFGIISMSLLWVAVIVLTVLVLLLYRQFGLAYMSGRARAGLQGLDLGARARPVALTGLDGSAHEIDWSAAPGSAAPGAGVTGPGATGPGATVLVFAQPSCPICGDLAADAAGLPASWPSSQVRLGGRHGHRPPAARRGQRAGLDRRYRARMMRSIGRGMSRARRSPTWSASRAASTRKAS